MTSLLRTNTAFFRLAALSLALAGSGCGGLNLQVDEVIDAVEALDRVSDQNNLVQDGTSNTIVVGERPTGNASGGPAARPGGGGTSEPVGGSQAGGDGQPRPVDTSSPAPPTSPAPAAQPPADQSAAIVAQLTQALGDTFLTFGDSSFFSSGSITESSELQLCAFGRFGMRVTTITSTSLDTFSSEDTRFGAWSVRALDGGFVLELNVDDASDPADVGIRQLVLTVNDDGTALFLDGARADVSDASADCEAARQ